MYVKSEDIKAPSREYLYDFLVLVRNISGILSNILSTLSSITSNTNANTYLIQSGVINSNTLISVSNMNSILFRNTGNSDGIVNGFILRPGDTLSISVSAPNKIGNIPVDGTGTTIQYILTYY